MSSTLVELGYWVAAALGGTGGCWLGIQAADWVLEWRARRRRRADR